VVFQVALAILAASEEILLACSFEEVLTYLKGQPSALHRMTPDQLLQSAASFGEPKELYDELRRFERDFVVSTDESLRIWLPSP